MSVGLSICPSALTISLNPPTLYVDPAADVQFLEEQLSSVHRKKKLCCGIHCRNTCYLECEVREKAYTEADTMLELKRNGNVP
jgi:hypothetical protein